MKKKILKSLLWLLGIILVLVIGVVIAFQVSPRPGAAIVRRMFDGPVTITDEAAYEVALKKVAVDRDQTYPSSSEKNTYDLYYPKDATKPLPVLVWVHGGGFVGGDKSGAQEFATKIAADAGIAVLTMNYAVAPDSQYPHQVLQVDDLIRELQVKQDERLNLDALFFGGDSAGAQIALQYVATQSNPAYGREVGLEPLIAKEALKGALSYCGPVDLQQMAHQTVSSAMMKFFVKTVAWSLIGTKDWPHHPDLLQASLVLQVTADFPPTYITDGNAYSFQEQGIALEEKLTSLGVPVTSLFFKDEAKEISHEYQFNYALPESQTVYQQTLDFLTTYQQK